MPFALWRPTADHPGIARLGGDGSPERFAIDLPPPDSPVYYVDMTSQTWADGVVVAEPVATFIAPIEDGTHAYH